MESVVTRPTLTPQTIASPDLWMPVMFMATGARRSDGNWRSDRTLIAARLASEYNRRAGFFRFHVAMTNDKQTTRTGAAKPNETQHLSESQKQALDVQADAEHTDGSERERLTQKMKQLGGKKKTPRS